MNHKLDKMTNPSFKRMTIGAASLLLLTAGAQFSYADVAAQPGRRLLFPPHLPLLPFKRQSK